jgi:hypothetical protein
MIQEAKDLAVLQQPWRTVCDPGAEVRDPGENGPLPTGGRSVNRNKTARRAPNHADGPYLVLGWSASNSCRADSPVSRGRSATPTRTVRQTPSGQNQTAKRIKTKTLKNTRQSRRTLGQKAPRRLSAAYRRTVRQA